jgi:hypothetical protein
MAMTKAERKEFEDVRNELRIYRALRWTAPVAPDVPKPAGGTSRETSGYVFNAYSRCVDPAWSTCVSHGLRKKTRDGSGSQNGIALYSTELLAYKGMRAAMELRFAHELAVIDDKIRELSGGDVP